MKVALFILSTSLSQYYARDPKLLLTEQEK